MTNGKVFNKIYNIYQVENLFTQVGEATLQAMLVDGVTDFVTKSISR
jgi:hypothetical protein